MAHRVLIVEDDADVRETLSLLLEAHGLAVQAAGDLDAALVQLANGVVDLILTDDNMHGSSSGPELARAVLGRRPQVPILLFTGSDQLQGLRQSGLFAEVLQKPSDPETLLAVIDDLLA